MRPRPTPVAPPPLDESQDFERRVDFQIQSCGPRDIARAQKGSRMISGEAQVLVQEQQ